MLKTIKSPWFLVVPTIVLGITALVLLYAGIIPIYYLFFTLVMWILVSGLGIAVGYHRIFSHKTHTLPRWKENIILFFATFAGQGTAIFWVSVHRGYHHPYTDTEKDIHSPVTKGIWNSFMGWLNLTRLESNVISVKYAVDLLRKPNFIWFLKNYYRLYFGLPLLLALYDWKLALCVFSLPATISLIQDNSVNVFGHLKSVIGYRNFDTPDNSYNNFLLGYLGWGQGWHNNHHAVPNSFNFGKAVSNRWWEFDPCVIFLPFIGKGNKNVSSKNMPNS
jgi:stearoyl-CoA desaturase (delta-9 desaturase)